MKKNNFAQKGSLILIVLITMTALVVIVHSMLRASAYLVLLAQEREGDKQGSKSS